jgi:glycosyltransferase involved in cell wall biosynthesis
MNPEPRAAVMLLTNKLELSPRGGREMLCRLNYDVLSDIYESHLTIFELVKKPISGFKSIVNAFKGHIDGVTPEVIRECSEIISKRNIHKIFVDGSNFGELVKQVKKKFPHVRIYTFFHNVEARFFWGSFNQTKSMHSLAVFIINYLAENKSVKSSDELICLSERDSLLLGKFYGRQSTHISSMALRDQLVKETLENIKPLKHKIALFVGGDFYANRVGISWFVKNVAPKIDFKVCIVGKGLEHYKEELEIVDNVQVIGAVDSLAEWYLNAHFVIAPIFDGSGMKTKVAEALMYGKKVIGTAEAFSGYEEVADRAGVVCNAADEFIRAIADTNKMDLADFDQDLRDIFEKKYSFEAAKERFMNILDFKS